MYNFLQKTEFTMLENQPTNQPTNQINKTTINVQREFCFMMTLKLQTLIWIFGEMYGVQEGYVIYFVV